MNLAIIAQFPFCRFLEMERYSVTSFLPVFNQLYLRHRPQQSGFTACWSTIDAILALRHLSEIHCKSERPLTVAHLAIKAAFDSVDHLALWKALRSTGVPEVLLHLIMALHKNTSAYKSPKTTIIQIRSTELAWQHLSCLPWARYGVTRSSSWVPRFACTRPLWCPFLLGHYFRVMKKHWRHSTWSANTKFCTYTGLSMSQMQKYPLTLANHLLWTSSEDVAYQYSATKLGSLRDSRTQRPTLPSRSGWGLKTSSWSSSR